MTDFFRTQLDFIFFCYGLFFILLVPITHFLNRRPQRPLSWGGLGLFGAAHGLNEWLDLLALDLGSDLIFDLSRLSLLMVSYLFLVEFGRAGTLTVRGRGFGRWVLVALLGVALLGRAGRNSRPLCDQPLCSGAGGRFMGCRGPLAHCQAGQGRATFFAGSCPGNGRLRPGQRPGG